MLHTLAEVRDQLDRDEDAAVAEAARRDAALVAELAAFRGSPARQLIAWARAAAGMRGDTTQPQAGVRGALRTVGAVMALAGIALGASLAAALLRYDGSQPVNVMPVLWIFVFAQALLLGLLWLAVLAPLPALRGLLGDLNPGRLWRACARLLPAGARARLQSLADASEHNARQAWRWQLLAWSQLLGLGLNAGAALGLLGSVALQDRAFAWSTQVEWLAARLPNVIGWLASPWAALFPQAAPSSALVEATRYSRFDAGSFSGGGLTPTELGSWWPFLLGCLLLYGVLPRLLSAWLCRARCRSASLRAIAHLPGAASVLARLDEPVQTISPDAVQPTSAPANGAPAQNPAGTPASSGLATPAELRDDNWVLVDWARSLGGDAAFPTALHLRAGGNTSIEDEARAVQRAAQTIVARDARGVVVATRGYEPPTLEITDLLADLREAIGTAPMYLLLVPAPDGGGHRARTSWQKQLGALQGQSGLELRVIEGVESPADSGR